MKSKRPIPEKTRLDQARASNPRNSAWVSANAGSGKTHVLAQRVIRLLLQGNRPDRLLCLTFTKAAAANMSQRVFKTLSDWSTLPDCELRDAITATGEKTPEKAEQLSFARKLFARALETPGGLRTLTIHAFCERVLHIAPFEANVPASFSILDDALKADFITRARRDVMRIAQTNPHIRPSLERVSAEVGLNFDPTFKKALERRSEFRALAAAGGAESLREALGLNADETSIKVSREIIEDGIPPSRWLELADFMEKGTATDQRRGFEFRQAHENWRTNHFDEAIEHLSAIYRKKTDGGPSVLLNKSLAKARPDLVAELQAEQDRFLNLMDRLAAARTAERSIALGVIVNAIMDRYEHLKANRQCLDFDDLIEKTLALLSRSSASWVLKKLDGGIDHILVDEAQDTSAAQWKILERVTDDFFSGEGQSGAQRTFFAVGDEKQSIFSFQGAEPGLFALKRKEFSKRAHNAGRDLEPVDLLLSFRSAPGILEAVDVIFSTQERFRGLSAETDRTGTVHEAWKSESPSRVEIWDVVTPKESGAKRDWKLPLDYRDETDAPVVAARRIARVISNWLRDGETIGLGSERRPIGPGDIMILVRRRDAFFEAMIRALKENSIPTAGSDRLDLARHIAIMDLLAIGRAALLPSDDLNLATALKTPLFGFDDEDLLKLAPHRSGALIDAVRASPSRQHQAACSALDLYARMAGELTPFEFFVRILGPRGGRRRMLARLGPESGDVLDEFLNLALAHQRTSAPSLHSFIAEIEALDGTIKRDMEASDVQVRVMTIHAAKGLEGKIVFLPDVCSAPTGRQDLPVFSLRGAGDQELPVWSPRKVDDCRAMTELRTRRREDNEDEYRRLLYVALTRAEERLYIAGHRGKSDIPPESWRMMIEKALAPLSREAPAQWAGDETVRRLGKCEYDEAPNPPEPRNVLNDVQLPEWLTRAPEAEVLPFPVLRPSTQGVNPQDSTLKRQSDPSARDEAMARGRAMHRLLEHLSTLAPERRTVLSRDRPPQEAEQMFHQASAILQDVRLAPLFGANSGAEVSFLAKINDENGGIIEVSGVIDRLGMTDTTVWIGEFKTGKPQRYHDQQLALYRAAMRQLFPEKLVRCFIIYLDLLEVNEVSDNRLDIAILHFHRNIAAHV
jgi:ATP-dependent helicase/nuclease subunit A